MIVQLYLLIKKTSEDISPENTPNYINSFFAKIGANLATGFQEDWRYDGEVFPNDFDFLPVTQTEVEPLIKQIEISKSSSIDNLSSRIIKDAFIALLPQVTYMFNLSIEKSVFPTSWKLAKITPLQKDGNKQDVSNLRPVSLLPLPGKMLERIIHNQLTKYLETFQILNKHQSGFRKHHSTIATISAFTDDIARKINNGNLTYALFVDFRKAFDVIDHNILLKKLTKLGLSARSVCWFTSYLCNRKQLTLVNNAMSSILPITTGVPQGSILGPLLFLIFINDIETSIKHSNIKLYADDTALYKASNDSNISQLRLQSDINSLKVWCDRNKLTINVNKTKIMTFGAGNKLRQSRIPDFYLNDTRLEHVSNYKYLGITLDSKLTYNKHVNTVIRTTSHKAYCLSKIRKYLTVKASLIIYKTTIIPYFDYGDFVYEAANKSMTEKLQRIQNRCLKTCLNVNIRESTDLIHRQARVNLLEDRRSTHLLNMMFQRSKVDEYVDSRNIYTRRHDGVTLKIPKPNKESFKKSVIFRRGTLWNLLPGEVRNLPTLSDFKKYTKQLQINRLR